MKSRILALTAASIITSQSMAAVILTNNFTTFQNSGTTSLVSTFEEFSPSGFSFPSDPYIQGGISYNNADNLIINGGTPYTTNGTNMLVNNYWNPVQGTFTQNFNLFGFDAGWSSSDDNGTTITIGTTLSTYIFNVNFDIASSADFYGFVADTNEFFTSFTISSNNQYALNAIDNVFTGSASNSTNVSEPASISLLGLAIAALGWSRRKAAK